MSRTAGAREEVAFFHELNMTETKVTRAERQRHVVRVFPSTEHLNWDRVFQQDVALMGRLIRDILKLQVQADEPTRPGPRSPLTLTTGLDHLRRLLGEDYTTSPFVEAFNALRGQRSLRWLAERLHMSKSLVARLADGEAEPSLDALQNIAALFGKHPSYFLEWRTAAVAAAVARSLEGAPEASIAAYRQLVFGTA